jgi:hypothetical protein
MRYVYVACLLSMAVLLRATDPSLAQETIDSQNDEKQVVWPLSEQWLFAPKYFCSVHWYFSSLGSTKEYYGVGESESQAVVRAQQSCLQINPSQWKAYCNTSPTRVSCDPNGACIPQRGINQTGYSNGHKTRWCQSQGFDTYDPTTERTYGQGTCVRSCPDPYCVKVPVRQLGYTQGNKSDFCKRLGFESQRDPAGKGDSGYCYTGPKDKCEL